MDEQKAIYPNHKMCIHCEPDVCAEADPARMGQLLSNLVSNAIKYGQEGAPDPGHVAQRNIRAARAG